MNCTAPWWQCCCSSGTPFVLAPLETFLWVDTNRIAPGDGSIASPFSTVQGALDFIGPPASLADENVIWRVVCVIGSGAPEAIVPPPRRKIILEHGSGLQSLDSVAWVDSAALGFGAPEAAVVLSGPWVVDNGVVISDAGGAGTLSIFVLDGAGVNGGIDATAVTGAGSLPFLILGTGAGLNGSSVNGDVLNPAGFVQADTCEFLGDCTALAWGVMERVRVLGETVWTATIGFLGPLGFVDSVFTDATTFTAPAATVLFDGASNYCRKLPPVTITNPPAVVTEDLVP